MGLAWRLRDIPEFARLPPGWQRGLLHLHPKWRAAWRVGVSVVLGLVVGAGSLSELCLSVAFIWWWGAVLGTLVSLVLAGACAAIVYQLQMRPIRTELRAIAHSLDSGLGLPMCVQCGYDLRGCPGPTCPECGAPFKKQAWGQAGGLEPGKVSG